MTNVAKVTHFSISLPRVLSLRALSPEFSLLEKRTGMTFETPLSSSPTPAAPAAHPERPHPTE